ncbi:MAG: lipocalin family protein, partial [Flavisolibacter sp.]
MDNFKKIFTGLSLLLIFSVSCKKEQKTDARSPIVGRWTVETAMEDNFYDGTHHESDFKKDGDYFDFSNDGTFQAQSNGFDGEGTWQLSDDHQKLTLSVATSDYEIFDVKA